MDTTANREGTLADFQECTGIDDVGEAILHLDEAKWDLVVAINRVMPQDTQTLPSELGSDVEVIEQIGPRVGSFQTRQQMVGPLPNGLPVSLGADFALPSTSHLPASTVYNFSIRQGETVAHINLLDTDTVNDLKMLIFSQLGVPVCQQVLTGWKSEPKSPSIKLGSLNLPKDNFLYLTVLDVDNNGMEVDVVSLSYTLTILDETRCKDYNVKYQGNQTVGGVKCDVHSLTDIPVRLQLWSGWPQGITDATTLAQAGLNRPVHDLSVRRCAKKEYKRIIVEVVESDSSVEEFEDASESLMGEDEMFVEEISSKRPQPLIPDNVEDETAGCIHFSDEFTNRYGAAHPDFFTGTLDEAIREACLKPAKERRLLAVYLHHDASVLTNVFCTQLLCFESVLQCLATNFVVWGWDLTFESNRAKFLSSLTLNLGPMAAMTVRNIETERLPALIIIMRMRSSTEVFTVVHGNVGVSELLTSLIQSVDVFTEQQRLEVREEEERTAREMIKIEQDQAYQESLQIDRAKEEFRRQQEKAETQEKRRVEREKQEEDAKKEAQRKALQSELPEEPKESVTNGITKIRFRLPKGEFLERRFRACDQLRVLLNFLVVQGYPMEDFKVISSWPRRDLTMLDIGSTLEALSLCPQETLILEER